MNKVVRRIFVEKKPGFDTEGEFLFKELKDFLGIEGLEEVRIIHRYDIEGISAEEYEKSRNTIFSEPPVDKVYDEEFEIPENYKIIPVEYLPGQYDQRADSAAQCIQLLTQGEKPEVRCAKIILVAGDISLDEFGEIEDYCINPLEARTASLEKPDTLEMQVDYPEKVRILKGFSEMKEYELKSLHAELGLAMSYDDLIFIQKYFRSEDRNPTITEIKVLDTYWSDHCRHTTFLTEIEDVEIEDGPYSPAVKKVYQRYLKTRETLYGEREKPVCLMDLAVIGMKEMRKRGLLDDFDESEEINACSIKIKVERNGQDEDWLLMFKNETHNHPTEIEPFGGAATCLGGAIRDPLSGRSYVYQAMRVTGSGDPRTPVSETMEGKLPQRKITTGAAEGYSSYGNQIGLATGQVTEFYNKNFVAKRMEVGAVIAAAPAENVVRERPSEGDIIVLLGGRTGRDGCGGATGSSKEHDEESLLTCGAEVQKGNPPTERKIQRLFRNSEVSKMIKRCNDFGAGGVSVAIGELADSLDIDLDAVPKKYEGLDGTELAISESQERMAVVLDKGDVDRFIEESLKENLEATPVAVVTDTGRMRLNWQGDTIVDISREFLDSNGVTQKSAVTVLSPEQENNYLDRIPEKIEEELSVLRKADLNNKAVNSKELKNKKLKDAWLKNLQSLNVCSQKGLVERFDSTIGTGSVVLPFGGKNQLTPVEGMVAKIPVLDGDTSTGSIMTFGYNPDLALWSPFHGAVYAVVDSVARSVALGGDYKRIRLSFQEYFESLAEDRTKWGKPFSALLGAYLVQSELGIAAIGGKDSMSGTFKDINVPPTLVSFAVNIADVNKTTSPEFKNMGSKVAIVRINRDEYSLPVFEDLKEKYEVIHELINSGKVLASSTVGYGGIAAAITKMSFGNSIGFTFDDNMIEKSHSADDEKRYQGYEYFGYEDLFKANYGSIILEVSDESVLSKLPEYMLLGETTDQPVIKIADTEINLDEALKKWQAPLEDVFPTEVEYSEDKTDVELFKDRNTKKPTVKVAKPRVFIPAFPGTNCEIDSARRFREAGAEVDTFVFKNLEPEMVEESVEKMVKKIDNSQIIMLPGGFSAGDEPEGSGKFIATVFRNPAVKEAVMRLLNDRDGLMLGICNGFQALVKLGLLPYGEIQEIDQDSPTLTFNTIGRHVSCMVRTRVVSTLSPWLSKVDAGAEHMIPVSHGEGRFIASDEVLDKLIKNGQIATQYVNFDGKATYDIRYNPNGSVMAIEGITSPDGRIFGKMGHSERTGSNVARNIPGDKDQKLFEAGVEYFKS
ncbi:MAG: phosphoribosylformylglycinamidine synthase [Halanaerobiales bacterium]